MRRESDNNTLSSDCMVIAAFTLISRKSAFLLSQCVHRQILCVQKQQNVRKELVSGKVVQKARQSKSHSFVVVVVLRKREKEFKKWKIKHTALNCFIHFSLRLLWELSIHSFVIKSTHLSRKTQKLKTTSKNVG